MTITIQSSHQTQVNMWQNTEQSETQINMWQKLYPKEVRSISKHTSFSCSAIYYLLKKGKKNCRSCSRLNDQP